MFLVVEFEETSEVAVVSASWLANDQLSVLWPPYKSSKKVDAAIQAHEVPEDHWSSWTVKRTMYRTDNFVKAVRKSRMAEDESDLQTDGEQPSLQKRKKRPNPRFMDSESDSESHDEGDVLPPPPPKVSHLMPRPSSVPTQPQSSSGRLDLPTPPALSRSSLSSPPPSVICAQQSPSLQLALPPPSALSRSSFSSPPPSVMRAQSSSFRLDLPPPSALSRSSFSSPPPSVMRTHSPSSIRRDLSSPQIYARPAPSSTHSTRPHTSSTPPPSTQRLSSLTPPSSTVIPERDIRFFRVMEEIREEVKETKAMVASIAQQMRADVRDSPLPEGISLPLGFEEELRAVEERLEDPTILKMMVAHLSSIGGANVKAMTRRIMKAAFRNQLAVAYNWTGAKDKLTFGTLMLTTAILRAVRRIFPASSTSEVEVHLKDWLRNAKDRDGGRKNRMRTPPAASVSDDET